MSSIILKLAPGHASLDWLILFTIITGLRVYFGLVRINHRLSINTACEWYGCFLLGSFVSGGLWCYLGLSVIPGLQVQAIDYVFLHAMNVLFIAGLTASTLFAFRHSMLAMLAFSLPAVVPYAVYLAVQANPYLPVLGTVFLIIYLFMLLNVLNHCQKQVQETGTASKTVQF
ncbi:MAG: hypothetical protein R3318_01525 [Gammaproteobacteria bacterium]|nr:hypothetical protein [Gammaproteobacteria bacterium]